MSKLAFVDTHVHFWDLQHPDLAYSWLQPDFLHPQIGGQLDGLKGKNYLAEDFIAETRSENVNEGRPRAGGRWGSRTRCRRVPG